VGSLVCLLAVFFAAPASAAAAPPTLVSVAAASNLVYAIDSLQADFQALHPGIRVNVATGASGSLVAQISHGAPYDVFLSADLGYPEALLTAGAAVPGSLRTFAVGRLVLWTTRADLPLEPLEQALRAPGLRRLAIAHTASAPYGRAAREVLQALGVWQQVQPRLLVGENITQAAQFVETGGADAGFVALSLVRSPRLASRGRWVLVPDSLHTPLAHGAVLTRRGANNRAAAAFLAYLSSAPARRILEQFGYTPPPVRP
jgi:molybdate transport system substrate-binding protein